MSPKTLAKTHFTNFNAITARGDNRERKNPAKSNIVFYGDEIFSDCPHKNSLETRTFYPIPSKLCHNVEQ
jgi:hypothetical protein